MVSSNTKKEILIVEDSKPDFLQIERAITKSGITNPIEHISHGDNVLKYLEKINCSRGNTDKNFPLFIFMDLNLPDLDGLQILKKLKNHQHFQRIPVLILSSSSDESDINNCYLYGANSYIVKPFAGSDLIAIMEKIKDYWISTVSYPER